MLEDLHPLPWASERYQLNGLEYHGDTHGWHWDDYAFVVVFIAKAPKSGGELHCVPNVILNRDNPQIPEIINSNKIQVYNFAEGEMYLMISNTTLHRVNNIGEKTSRLSLAMAYCNNEDLKKEMDHKSVYRLYY